MNVPQWTPSQVQAALAADDAPLLLDVREASELRAASLPGAVHIPMGEVGSRGLRELDPDRTIVVMCHHGIRSMRVALFLKSKGYDEVINLAGGIDAWSQQVDATVPRY